MTSLLQIAKEDSLVLQRKNRRAKTLASQDKIKIISSAIAVILIIVLGALLYAWSNFRIIYMGYEMAGALNERKQLIEINERLNIELATLRSPDRIESLAVQKLGMRTPKAQEFITIK